MKILTLDNISFSLNNLPEEINEDMRFAVLDNNDIKNPDFYFMPLVFLESFNSSAIVLKIGNNEIIMPSEWSILIGDSHAGEDLIVKPLMDIDKRNYEAFLFNPKTSFRLEYQPIEIINIYNDIKWYFPKMKINQLLAYPIEDSHNPLCAYFVKDINRQNEVIYIDRIL